MLNEFELVCFDAGGTLLRPYPSVGEIYSRTAQKHGCIARPEEIEKRFRDLWHRKDAIASLVSYSDEKIEKEWWALIVKEVFAAFPPVRDFDAFFTELYEDFGGAGCWQLYPETLTALEAVKNSGKKMCIISNWDSRLLKLCKAFEIEGYFDFILISAVFGASKPNPKIFQEALQIAGVHSSKAVHIGDSLEDDIRGAANAGMHSVFLDRHSRERHGYSHFENVPVISALDELI